MESIKELVKKPLEETVMEQSPKVTSKVPQRNPLDLNGDGVVDEKDITEVIKIIKEGDWKSLIGVVVAIIVFLTKKDIILLFDGGSSMQWMDFGFNTVMVGCFVAFVNYMSQMMDTRIAREEEKHGKTKCELKKARKDIRDLQTDLREEKASNKLAMQTEKSAREIEKIQIQGALDHKNDYLDDIKNGVIKLVQMEIVSK